MRCLLTKLIFAHKLHAIIIYITFYIYALSLLSSSLPQALLYGCTVLVMANGLPSLAHWNRPSSRLCRGGQVFSCSL